MMSNVIGPYTSCNQLRRIKFDYVWDFKIWRLFLQTYMASEDLK